MNKKHDPNLTSALAGVCLLLGSSSASFAADTPSDGPAKPLDHAQLWNAVVGLLSEPEEHMDVKAVETTLHVKMKANLNPIDPSKSYSGEAGSDSVLGVMLVIPASPAIERWSLSFTWLNPTHKTSNYVPVPRDLCIHPNQIEADFTAAGWAERSNFFPFQPSSDDIATASATFIKGTIDAYVHLTRDGLCFNGLEAESNSL